MGTRPGLRRSAHGLERVASVAPGPGRARQLSSKSVERRRSADGIPVNPIASTADPALRDRTPRVAYFPDSFHEVNGVAHTSRHFEAFARRRNLPFLCVRAGDRAQAFIEDGNVWTLELPRGFLSFALEKDLRFDPAFLRHIPLIGEVLERFQPDLIHITGPSEVGMLGAALAHHLRSAAGRQLAHQCARVPGAPLGLVSAPAAPAPIRRRPAKNRRLTMAAAAMFYSTAQVLFAPNPELCALLERTPAGPAT